MREVIESRSCCIEGVLKCYPHETLETIIDRIAEAEVSDTKEMITTIQSIISHLKPRYSQTNTTFNIVNILFGIGLFLTGV